MTVSPIGQYLNSRAEEDGYKGMTPLPGYGTRLHYLGVLMLFHRRLSESMCSCALLKLQ